jgi:hypothetical protein
VLALVLAGCAATAAPAIPGARRGARATAGLPRFVPQSVSFISPSSGWAWGPARPHRSSSAGVLARTGDFGRSWSARVEYTYAQPGQPGGYSGVRFADARHGWLFGDGLLATGDGGRHWQAIRTAGNVLELETAGGAAYAVALPCASAERCVSLHLYRVTDAGLARIGPRRPFYAASLIADGASVYLLINAGRRRGSMLWASYDRGRSWRVLRSPCPWNGTDSWALAAGRLAVSVSPAARREARAPRRRRSTSPPTAARTGNGPDSRRSRATSRRWRRRARRARHWPLGATPASSSAATAGGAGTPRASPAGRRRSRAGATSPSSGQAMRSRCRGRRTPAPARAGG